MLKCLGKFTILIGIGLFLISFFFATNHRNNFDISKMEIILKKGIYVTYEYPHHWDGRIAIPLKYPFSISTIIVLIGIGCVFIPKK